MFRFLSKVIAAVAVTAAAGLAAPGLANADVPSEQVYVCSAAGTIHFQITGPNQSGNNTQSPTNVVPAGTCYYLQNWWWQKGATLVVAFGSSPTPASSWKSFPFKIDSKSNAAWHQVQVNCPSCGDNVGTNYN
ncbi:hypothetical protein [Kutzneria buriramensis]|uniref:hypothetical protein n=1 Tax=Kutzneria buriramensis TaxID=1045776 RepID=UPI0011C18804|nr:hypothetical protein [Kutzneria buriramensis]